MQEATDTLARSPRWFMMISSLTKPQRTKLLSDVPKTIMTKTIARCGAWLFSSQICPGHSCMNAPLRVKTPQRFSDNACACPLWAMISTARLALMLVLVSLHFYYMIIYLYQYECIQPLNIYLILSRLPLVLSYFPEPKHRKLPVATFVLTTFPNLWILLHTVFPTQLN